jgi:hypothetical protein
MLEGPRYGWKVSLLGCGTSHHVHVFLMFLLIIFGIFRHICKVCSVGGIFYVFVTTLVNNQLDAQFFYFIIRLLQSSTCFEQRRAYHEEVKLY